MQFLLFTIQLTKFSSPLAGPYGILGPAVKAIRLVKAVSASPGAKALPSGSFPVGATPLPVSELRLKASAVAHSLSITHVLPISLSTHILCGADGNHLNIPPPPPRAGADWKQPTCRRVSGPEAAQYFNSLVEVDEKQSRKGASTAYTRDILLPPSPHIYPQQYGDLTIIEVKVNHIDWDVLRYAHVGLRTEHPMIIYLYLFTPIRDLFQTFAIPISSFPHVNSGTLYALILMGGFMLGPETSWRRPHLCLVFWKMVKQTRTRMRSPPTPGLACVSVATPQAPLELKQITSRQERLPRYGQPSLPESTVVPGAGLFVALGISTCTSREANVRRNFELKYIRVMMLVVKLQLVNNIKICCVNYGFRDDLFDSSPGLSSINPGKARRPGALSRE
ncbi:hypothetical protein C8Q74DRAFT_1222539 [Fomes fomentarius]|nr:hypothetical protein C8Q74DRAFT_1222539 [Fomes fomentarius]